MKKKNGRSKIDDDDDETRDRWNGMCSSSLRRPKTTSSETDRRKLKYRSTSLESVIFSRRRFGTKQTQTRFVRSFLLNKKKLRAERKPLHRNAKFGLTFFPPEGNNYGWFWPSCSREPSSHHTLKMLSTTYRLDDFVCLQKPKWRNCNRIYICLIILGNESISLLI